MVCGKQPDHVWPELEEFMQKGPVNVRFSNGRVIMERSPKKKAKFPEAESVVHGWTNDDKCLYCLSKCETTAGALFCTSCDHFNGYASAKFFRSQKNLPACQRIFTCGCGARYAHYLIQYYEEKQNSYQNIYCDECNECFFDTNREQLEEFLCVRNWQRATAPELFRLLEIELEDLFQQVKDPHQRREKREYDEWARECERARVVTHTKRARRLVEAMKKKKKK